MDGGRMEPAPSVSILFEQAEAHPGAEHPTVPDHFYDLNLDQVVARVVQAHPGSELESVFYLPLRNREEIAFRHEVFQDLDGTALFAEVVRFTARMRTVKGRLARSRRANYAHEQQRWHLDAALAYCDAVTALQRAFDAAGPRSRGLRAASDYLAAYVRSWSFSTLAGDSRQCSDALAGVTYCVHVEGGKVQVSPFRGEADCGPQVEEAFARFAPAAPGSAHGPGPQIDDNQGLDHVEARVLDLVAKHYPEVFARLARFCEVHDEFLDSTVVGLDEEAYFYVAFLEHINRLRLAGLGFCYPQLVDSADQLSVSGAFDLALAGHLVQRGVPVVSNDLHFQPGEHVFVVTGPNQGGKTTFARMVGQLHYLASLGCPVPGTAVRVPLPDQIFTHFARRERPSELRGALEDDLVRARSALNAATARSIFIFNEIFTSTTSDDAACLGRRLLQEVVELEALCVYVTFVDELASLSEAVVSMVATVSPNDPSVRTYKLVRRPADGRAYAAALAEKYGLSYERLKERVAP